MPRVEWSFLLPAQDHKEVKKITAYLLAALTPWGQIILLIIWVGLAISSVGTQISAYFLPSFILSLLVASNILALFFKPKVEVKRILPPFPSAGQDYTYTVRVKNISRHPLRQLQVFEQCLPFGLYSSLNHPHCQNSIDWLDPGESKDVRLVFSTPRRGTFELSPLIIGTSFPSGIIRARRRLGTKERFIVYPKIIQKENLIKELEGMFQPGGLSTSRKCGDSNEFASTREYRQGDRMRDVHWSSSARLNKLIVKEYIEEYYVRVGLFIDTELRRFEKHASFEGRVSLCAGLTDQLIHKDYVVDLFLSDAASHHLQIGRGADDYDKLLEFLALPEGDRTVDFHQAFHRLKKHGEELSLLYLFFKDWNEERKQFVDRLNQNGIQTQTIIISARPPTLNFDPTTTTYFAIKDL